MYATVNFVIVGSDNGSLSAGHRAIIRTNAALPVA